MGKNIGYYPKGAKNQHKMMATGEGLKKPNKANKETVPHAWGGQKGVPGKVRKSGTSTGSGGKSRGHSVPASTFTKA